MPTARAFWITRFIAMVVTTGPKARSASRSKVAGVSVITWMLGRVFMRPLSTSSAYQGIRSTPWESTPRRFAQTRTSADTSASSGLHPTLTNTSFVNAFNACQSTRTSCVPMMLLSQFSTPVT